VEQDLVTVLLPDDPYRLVDLREVVAEAADEVGRLVGAQRPAVLAQVQGVEVEAPLDVEVGQVLLEEVVDEAMDVQHRPPPALGPPAPYERGHDIALGVLSQRKLDRLVLGPEHIGRHVHETSR
jgi:hypothetical protein